MKNRAFSIVKVGTYDSASYPGARTARLLRRGGFVTGALLLGALSCNYQLEDKESCGTPGVQCDAAYIAHICHEDGTEQEMACESWCNEQYGIDAYAIGCSADIDSPCICETDIIDGFMSVCEPNDFTCLDDETVSICVEGTEFTYETVSCDDLCTEQYGEDYYSDGGCDAEATENPCQCITDMMAGAPAQITPDDLPFK